MKRKVTGFRDSFPFCKAASADEMHFAGIIRGFGWLALIISVIKFERLTKRFG